MIKNLLDSFKNNKDGYARRKLTAFALMICISYCHWEYVDISNVVEVLIIDLCGVLLCLGLVTAQNVIELKNGGGNPQIEKKQDPSSESQVS